MRCGAEQQRKCSKKINEKAHVDLWLGEAVNFNLGWRCRCVWTRAWRGAPIDYNLKQQKIGGNDKGGNQDPENLGHKVREKDMQRYLPCQHR